MSPIALLYLMNHIKTEEEVRTLFLGPMFTGWRVLSDIPHYYLPLRIRTWRRYGHPKRYEVINKIANMCSLDTLRDLLTAILPTQEMDLVQDRRFNIVKHGRQLGLMFNSDLATYRHHNLEVAVISQNVLDRVEDNPSVALIIAKLLTFRTPKNNSDLIQADIGRKEEIHVWSS